MLLLCLGRPLPQHTIKQTIGFRAANHFCQGLNEVISVRPVKQNTQSFVCEGALAQPEKTRSSSACHVGPHALERLIIFEQF